MRSAPVRLAVVGAVSTMVASLCLTPLFSTSASWFGHALLIVAAIMVLGLGLRRLRVPEGIVALAQLLTVTWSGLAMAAHDTMTWGIAPIRPTWQALGSTLANAFDVMQVYATPVPPDASLNLLTAISIGLVAILVDMFAAGLRQAAWAGLPILAVYAIPAAVLPAALGSLAFLLPAAAYLLLLATDGSLRIRTWGRAVGTSRAADEGSSTRGRDEDDYDEDLRVPLLGSTGRRVGFAAVALAVAVPALLPTLPQRFTGNGTAAGAGGDGKGRTISVGDPVVTLNRDLRRGDNIPLFSYRVTEPDGAPGTPNYISTVVLDKFNGKEWKPSPRVVPSNNSVQDAPRLPDPPGLMTDNQRKGETYRFRIDDDYSSAWLPLAYPPSVVHIDGDWRYDESTFDLVAAAPGLSTAGAHYTETVAYTAITPAKLRNAGPAPADVAAEYTALPSRLPDAFYTQLNQAVKGHKRSKYDIALAIQQYFRRDFHYSLETAPGSGMQALVNFLGDRTGYCQQFAATMALMARAEGIPARVVVGFLPGTEQSDGSYLVRAHDAHSWPELYFAGYGWVRFEPTPSARTGAAPSWANPATAGAIPKPRRSTEASPRANDQQPLTVPRATQPPRLQRHPLSVDVSAAAPTTPWWRSPITPLVLGLLALAVCAPGLVRTGVRWFRLRRGQPTGIGVERAWQELLDRSRDLGLTVGVGLSVRAAADAIAHGFGEHPLRPVSDRADDPARDALTRLRLLVERSRYSPYEPVGPDAANPGRLVRRVDAGLRAELPLSVRLRAWLTPPALLGMVRSAVRSLVPAERPARPVRRPRLAARLRRQTMRRQAG